MTPGDPLAALHPLREPQLIGWWPPAPGWWLLLGSLLLALALLVWFLLRRRRARAYRRRALLRLEAIYTDYREHGNRQQCLQQVNALLKSVALHAYPRRRVAAACGAGWVAFLNDTGPAPIPFEPAFTEELYRAGVPAVDLDTLRSAAARWITRHEVTA